MATFRDPYLAWSMLTGFGGHAAMGRADARIPLLIEADAAQRDALRAQYVAVSEPPQAACGFCTALVSRDELFSVESTVPSMEMALPIDVAEVPQATQLPSAPSAEPVIAVIDHGCAMLQRSFRSDRGGTRLMAVWDQGRSDAKAPWQRPQGFGYGRELSRSALDVLLHRLADGSSEAALYAALDYLLDAGMCRETAHGTHVLDAIGGGVDEVRPLSSAKPPRRDPASQAPLIFVDVPSQQAHDSTGAANGAFLLDALRYIRSRAGQGVPVVVNVSLGAFAGPHDGTSLVERAMDDFLRHDQSMVLTVAAGNAALERWHASGGFDQGDDTVLELRWRTMPEDTTDSFVELWFDAVSGDGSADLELEVLAPNGRSSSTLAVDDGEPHPICDVAGSVMGAVIGRRPTASAGGAMFLVAAGPTAGARRMAPAGIWRLRLRNRRTDVPVRFDAWIQRDEPGWNTSRFSVQSFFESASPGVVVGGAAGGLSNLATGSQTIVVGATRAEDGQLSRYTSLGGRPRRDGVAKREIDVAAPADESNTAIGLLAAAVRSGMLLRMGGTSVAAPVAARQIYNHIANGGAASAARESQAPPQSLSQRQRSRMNQLPTKTRRPLGQPNALQVSRVSPEQR